MLQKIKDNFSFLIIAVLVIVIIFLRSCGPKPEPQKPVITIKYDTVYIPVKKDTIYVPGVTKYLPGEIIPVNGKVDTLAILKDYFAKRYYQDTVKIDKYGYLLVRDTITQNRVISRKTKLDIKIPVITKTVTIDNPPKQVNQIYIGGTLGGNKTQIFNFIGPSILLKTKQEKIYSLSLGLSSSGNIGYAGSIYWKIRLKK